MEKLLSRGGNMKIRVLRSDSNELKIEIEGEGHTFCNMLQKALLEDGAVEFAGYDMPHPLMTKFIVYVQTRGKRRPEVALHDAAEKLRERSTELRKAFEGAFKKYHELQASDS